MVSATPASVITAHKTRLAAAVVWSRAHARGASRCTWRSPARINAPLTSSNRINAIFTQKIFEYRNVPTSAPNCSKPLITSEANLKSAADAVQIFGGRGYLTETGMEKELRDAMGGTIYSGTSEVQRVKIARLLGIS